MKEKAYSGYKAYQYLDPGRDFRVFEFEDPMGRAGTYRWDLSDSQEQHAMRLLDDNLVISLHEHPSLQPVEDRDVIDYKRSGRTVTAYEELSKSGLDAVFDNFMDGTVMITSEHAWKWNDVLYDFGMKYSDFAHQDMVVRAETVEDILDARIKGKIALVACIEALTPIENELDRIDVLYGYGIRLMGLVYSQTNAIGGGLAEKYDTGLSALGEHAVERINKLGALVDVSHCSDQTSLDAIRLSKDPVVISHAGARAVWDSKRMKPDEVIRECAEKGGIIGIEAAPHTTLSVDHKEHSLDSVMDHFEYCVDLVGIDHVTFGPDTNYGDHVRTHRLFDSYFSTDREEAPPYRPVKSVSGIENPTESFPNIVRWLVKHNYSDDEIKKVIGGNVLRILGEVWQ